MYRLSQLTPRQRELLFSQQRLLLTHHSSAIEGITLTQGETFALLERGVTAGDKPLSEQLVVLGHARAFDMVVREAGSQSLLSVEIIKDIHALLFEQALNVCPDKVSRPVGAYRLDQRSIKGASVELADPRQIANKLENLLYSAPSNTLDDLEKIGDFHVVFERIHPFADGNGRVGRLLIVYHCIQNDLIPPLIQNEYRNEYLDSFDNGKMGEFLATMLKPSLDLIKYEG